MNNLPPEILATIADNIYDIDNICKMREVCRSFEDGVANSRRWRGLQELKKLEPDLKGEEINNDSCLELAARHGVLILFKASPERIRESDPCKYFRIACCYDKMETVKYFVEEFNLPPLSGDDARSKNNYALRNACGCGHLNVIKYLRKKFALTGDDARAMNNYALRYACKYGYLSVVKYLRKKFRLTTKDARTDDNYALRQACANGHLEVVKYLKEEFGLMIDDARIRDNCALRLACNGGHLLVIKYLREEFNLTGNDALYTLKCACEHGHLEMVKYLRDEFSLPLLDGDDARALQ